MEVGQHGVEHLDVDGSDVAPHPILERPRSGPSVLDRPDGAAGDQVAVLGVERPAVSTLIPAAVSHRSLALGDPLDDGDDYMTVAPSSSRRKLLTVRP